LICSNFSNLSHYCTSPLFCNMALDFYFSLLREEQSRGHLTICVCHDSTIFLFVLGRVFPVCVLTTYHTAFILFYFVLLYFLFLIRLRTSIIFLSLCTQRRVLLKCSHVQSSQSFARGPYPWLGHIILIFLFSPYNNWKRKLVLKYWRKVSMNKSNISLLYLWTVPS
jgi:hypothetical protein